MAKTTPTGERFCSAPRLRPVRSVGPRISVRAAPPSPESITPQLVEAARKEGK